MGDTATPTRKVSKARAMRRRYFTLPYTAVVPLSSQRWKSFLECRLGSLWLLLFVAVSAVGFFDTELLQTVLQRPEGEAEEFGGLGDVVVRLLHGLCYQVALDVFEVNPFGR